MSSFRLSLLLVLFVVVALFPPARLGSAEPECTAPPEDKKVHKDFHGDSLPSEALAWLGTVRFRQEGEVSSLACAPNGKTLASAGPGGTFLWDVATAGDPSLL